MKHLIDLVLPPGSIANAWMYAAAREKHPPQPGPLSVDLAWEKYDRLGPVIHAR